MQNTEMSFAKTGVLTTKDWDTYQAILRNCLRFRKPPKAKRRKQKSS